MNLLSHLSNLSTPELRELIRDAETEIRRRAGADVASIGTASRDFTTTRDWMNSLPSTSSWSLTHPSPYTRYIGQLYSDHEFS